MGAQAVQHPRGGEALPPASPRCQGVCLHHRRHCKGSLWLRPTSFCPPAVCVLCVLLGCSSDPATFCPPLCTPSPPPVSGQRCATAGDSCNDILMLDGRMPAIIVGNAQKELVDWYHRQNDEGRIVLTDKSDAAGVLEGLARHRLM